GAVGIINLSNGSISGGEADSNDHGTLDKNCGTLTDWTATACYVISSGTGGGYSIANNGRGSLSFAVTAGGKTNQQVGEIYVISAGDFYILQNSDQTTNSVWGGEALQQSGSFSNSTLNGKAIFYQSGFDCNGTNCTINVTNGTGTAGSNTIVAVFSANGSGSGSGTFYSSSSGSISTGSISGATYSIDSNGRGLFTLPSATTGCSSHCTQLFYFAGTNRAFDLSDDNGVGSGALEPQTTSSFSTGTYAFGGIDPAVPSIGLNEGMATFTSGNVSGTNDNNDPQNGLKSGGAISGSYTVDGTGFGQVGPFGGTCTPTSGNCQFLFYVVSPNRAIGMSGSNSPEIQPADQ
ncbi:MAG: hypothetical protein KGL75_05450, partial [Acidobacteriota bacterium]|nr:hypothetical protein [Acidobacteriota bacterium]